MLKVTFVFFKVGSDCLLLSTLVLEGLGATWKKADRSPDDWVVLVKSRKSSKSQFQRSSSKTVVAVSAERQLASSSFSTAKAMFPIAVAGALVDDTIIL